MTEAPETRAFAFRGDRLLAEGTLAEVAAAAREAQTQDGPPILVFDAAAGRVADLDLRGDAEAVRARHAPTERPAEKPAEKKGRGRPRLGVVAREVTLLPRHWDWLARRPGGASAALRRMVDQARKAEGEGPAARDRAYAFMHAFCGDLPGFEAASRALFAGDASGFASHVAAWPQDLSTVAQRLAAQAFTAPPQGGQAIPGRR